MTSEEQRGPRQAFSMTRERWGWLVATFILTLFLGGIGLYAWSQEPRECAGSGGLEVCVATRT